VKDAKVHSCLTSPTGRSRLFPVGLRLPALSAEVSRRPCAKAIVNLMSLQAPTQAELHVSWMTLGTVAPTQTEVQDTL